MYLKNVITFNKDGEIIDIASFDDHKDAYKHMEKVWLAHLPINILYKFHELATKHDSSLYDIVDETEKNIEGFYITHTKAFCNGYRWIIFMSEFYPSDKLKEKICSNVVECFK